VFLSSSVFAQSTLKSDSLLTIARSSKTIVENRIAAYTELVITIKNIKSAEAIAFINEAVPLIEHSGKYQMQLTKLYQYKGEAYMTIGERDSAMYYYVRALKKAESLKEPLLLASVYNVIARFYRENNPERAILYYDKAMSIYEELHDEEGIATILNESGVAYEYKNDFDEAIKKYEASLTIQKKRKDEVGIGYSLEFLSGAYLQKGNLAKAEKYIFDALQSRRKTKDSFALAMNYSNIASVYSAMRQWLKSIDYFDTSNQFASCIHYPNLLAYNFKELANIYKQQSDYKKAFEAIEHYNVYKDSIFTIEKEKNIEELNTRYETEKNKRFIEEQKFAIIKRNYWIAAVLFLLFTGAIVTYLFHKRNRQKQQARLQSIVMEQQEHATKAIIETEEKERQRIAMDLHDGVGQMMSAAKIKLSTIESDLVFNEDNLQHQFRDIVNLVDDSCRELRNISHNMIPNGLLKNSLAFAVRDFLNKISSKVIKINLFTSGLDKRLDTNIETVLYRIIQESVNNVIKHAQASSLDIALVNEENQIIVTIEDNGIGFNAKEPSKYQGIGLKNIMTRVAYLKGNVEFDSAPGRGTVTIIHVPLA